PHLVSAEGDHSVHRARRRHGVAERGL
ncbi:hypothetical protein, partial [Alicyclobacillus mali (ex Roth et al. 2021)]